MKKPVVYVAVLTCVLSAPLIPLANADSPAPTATATAPRAKAYNHKFDAPLLKAISDNNESEVGKYLKKGADPNAYGTDQYRTPALCLIETGTSLGVLRALIDGGADLQCTNSQGNAPLIFAALKNRSDVIELLLQRGADIEANKFDGLTALMIAASSGSVDATRTLIRSGANVNALSTSKGTALIYGSSSTIAGTGNLDILKMLVAAGADVSVKAANDKRAYDIAASNKLYTLESYLVDIYNRDNKLFGAASEAAGLSNGVFPNAWADIRVALDSGANGHFSNDAGSTALIMLALDVKGYDEATLKRVIAVSDVNAHEHQGLTALHACADRNNAPLAALLIASKASLDLPCDDGRSPLDMAIGRKSDAVAALLRAAGAKTLKNHDVPSTTAPAPQPAPVAKQAPALPAPPNSLPKGPLDVIAASSGKSPLMKAAYNGNTDEIAKLLAQGAVIDFPNTEGHTALFFAAYGGEVASIKALVKAGADINFVDKEGKTALVSASFAGEDDTILALVKAGADLKYLDAAIDYAKFGKNTAVIEYLTSLKD